MGIIIVKINRIKIVHKIGLLHLRASKLVRTSKMSISTVAQLLQQCRT